MKKILRYLKTSLILTLFININVWASETDGQLIDSLRIDEVVVTGSRPPISANLLPVSVSVITERQLENRMEQSILPILTEQVPSLFVTSRGVMGYGISGGSAGGMTLRGIGGAPTTQLLVLIDGHPQYMGLMGHPLADSYQTLMAERVEVVRGPSSVLYGSNAAGGVINIITKQKQQDGVDTHLRAMYGSFNTFTAEASNAVRSGKFNSLISLGYDRTDGHRKNMGFEQYTGYTKIGYDFSPNWKSFVDLDITKFETSNPGTVELPRTDAHMDVTRGVASFSLQNNYGRTSGALKFFYNFGYHKVNDGYIAGNTPPSSRFRSRDEMLGITAFQNYSFFNGNQTTFGFDYQHFGGRAWNIYIDGRDDANIVKEKINDVAGYINIQQRLIEKLSVNAGVRIDHHSITGTEWIPQAGISWFAANNTVVKGIVSKGFRNPTIRELYMFGTQNPDLEPENFMNYEISLNQGLLNNDLNLGLNIYYIKGDNTIVSVETQEGWMWMNTGDIENYGLELTGNYRINNNLSVNANYSYLHMEHAVVASPEHKLYAGLDYTNGNWSFSTGLQFIRNLITETGKETFTLWNARVSYKIYKSTNIFVRGENLLAQRYEINSGFPMPRATVFGGIVFRL